MKNTRKNLLALAAMAALYGSAHAETTRLMFTFEPAPGGGVFIDFDTPTINNAGQVATISETTTGQGLFRADGLLPVVAFGRVGQAAPGGGTYSSLSTPVIGGNGSVAFHGRVSGVDHLFLASGGSAAAVMRSGTAAPGGGNFINPMYWGINQGGTVAFAADTTTGQGMFRYDGGLVAYVRAGAAAPGTGGGTFGGFAVASINNSGAVGFIGFTSAGPGVFRGNGPGDVSPIARAGAAAPGGGTFSDFSTPVLINSTGRVAFLGAYSGGHGLFHGAPGDLIAVARLGDAAPDGGNFISLHSQLSFNDANQIAFIGHRFGGSSGVYRGDGGEALTTIASSGQTMPGGNGQLANFFGGTEITKGGAVLYRADLSNTTGGGIDNQALILSDGIDHVVVARKGQAVDGSTIGILDVRLGFDQGGLTALNDNGQVAYTANLTNGSHGVYRFTPDLHWRGAEFDFEWDNAPNWTLGIKPASVHRVFIDPQGSGNINGPTTNTTIKSLRLGGTLRDPVSLWLNHNITLTTTGDVQIDRLGNLEHNAGTLAALGTLTNHGVIILNQPARITTGSGLVNVHTLVASGGDITGGTITNQITGRLIGDTSITAPVINYGSIEPGAIDSTGFARNGTLGFTTLTNYGLLSLPAQSNITTSSSLTNTGRIQLGGGAVGGAALTNSLGGVIDVTTAPPSDFPVPPPPGPTQSRISAPLTNSGGIIQVAANASLHVSEMVANNSGGQIRVNNHGTLNLVGDFPSSGSIALAGDNALLVSENITNTGTIRGFGTIAGTIFNEGTVRAEGGQLIIGGAASTNDNLGQIQVPASSSVTYLQGLAVNEATISLSGGTFDNNNRTITNKLNINGAGTFRSGGLTNQGLVSVADGPTTFHGPVTNEGDLLFTDNTTTFFGAVNNASSGTIKTTAAVARFLGTFTNTGTYNSDPSDNFFFDVNLAGGTWTGGVGDRFFIKGTLNWTAGSMHGSGDTFSQGSATLHDAGVKTLNGWNFHNEKPLTMSGGNLDMGNGAIINNTNTFDIQSDASITNTLGDDATFSNTATLRKSGGTGSSGIAARVNNNNGTIDVQTGTLHIQGGLNIATGTNLNKTGAGTLRIAGPQPHGINATLTASAGTIRLASNAGVPATAAIAATRNLALNITGSNSAVILDSHQDVRELNIPFADAGTQSLDLNSPGAPGAFNAIRVYSADLAAAKATLWSALKAGLSGSEGIFDSGRAAHPGSGIALARINDIHGDAHVQLRLARIGDLNLDGTVSIADFIDLASNFNASGPNITWQEGDLNYDSTVSIADFIDLAANFNGTYSGEMVAVNPADYAMLANFASSIGVDPGIIGSAVPEPAGMAVMGMGAMALLMRGSRRRRR